MRVMDEVEDAIQALRQALAQREQEPSKQFHEWACAEHQKRVAESANSTTSVVESKALAQPEQECIYPECETGIGCDGPCGEKPVDTVKQEPAVYKCPRCATSMDVDLNAKPVDTINTSQERETAKRGHEPVAFGFQNTAITESNRWTVS